jgi:hypothetical protein
MVNSVAMQYNNRATVFSMRSVPATIGKLFILYRPTSRNARRCSGRLSNTPGLHLHLSIFGLRSNG